MIDLRRKVDEYWSSLPGWDYPLHFERCIRGWKRRNLKIHRTVYHASLGRKQPLKSPNLYRIHYKHLIVPPALPD